jgi:type I restriction enzyme S subunit
MKVGWRRIPFLDAVCDESGGNVKTPESEFLLEGRFAVVDQGKELIAGYVNDDSRLCHSTLPVIVFGDHTRCFKFIDFPFCMGADGIKVLRPKGDVDVKYLYHYLRQLRLTEGGYDRHFKYLKRTDVVIPPLVEQRRIAAILDQAEALRAKRRAALAQLDTLTQAIFLDLFGDPISNPRKWPQETLETLFHFRTGKLDSNAAVASGRYPFFTCSREDFRIDTYAFDCEALLLAGNNASADYSVKRYKGKFNAYQRTYVITLQDEKNSYEYAQFVLEHRLAVLKRISKGTNTKYLTMELLNRLVVPVPPEQLQREFTHRLAAVEKLKSAHRASIIEMDALFASLQQRSFRGEL